jgi:hypothetical protein
VKRALWVLLRWPVRGWLYRRLLDRIELLERELFPPPARVGGFRTATILAHKAKADRIRTMPGTYSPSPRFMAMGIGYSGAAKVEWLEESA